MAELIAFEWLIAALEFVIREYGIETVRSEVANRPRLRELMLQVLGDSPAPPPVSPLAPFRVENNQILKDGRVWKFLGMNFRELPFFGLGLDPIRYATMSHFYQQLDGAAAKQTKVIRVFCSHPAVSVENAIPLVKRVLDEAAKRNLYVILCLTDGAGAGQFYVPETPDLKDGRYTWKFLTGGYKNSNYTRYVDQMTKALGEHSAIFSWEICNEITALTWPLSDDQANGVLGFFRDTAALIRTNSPRKMISTGSISSWELFVERAYANGNYAVKMALETVIDIIDFHSYPVGSDVLGETGQHIRDEIALLNKNNVKRVAYILEETAARWDDQYCETSADPVSRQVDELFKMGFSAALLWGVSFPYNQDIGVFGSGYFNGQNPPHSTRWHNIMGWFSAIATELARAFGS